LVWCGVSASPGIGGTKGREPVAMTKRRARMRWGPASTSVSETKRARSRITWTPRPSNRSWLSTGAIVSITASTWSLAAAKSGAGSWAATPKAPCPVACALWPAASNAFDGTQP
jgi:hypothetical protein